MIRFSVHFLKEQVVLTVLICRTVVLFVDLIEFYTVFSVLVTEGKVSFTMRVAPEMAPFVQVVAYAVLPSENVIAHSVAFSVEKCFSHKVSTNQRK